MADVKLDRQTFVETGAKGGRARGASKVRGDSDYYRRLAEKAAAARKQRKEKRP